MVRLAKMIIETKAWTIEKPLMVLMDAGRFFVI